MFFFCAVTDCRNMKDSTNVTEVWLPSGCAFMPFLLCNSSAFKQQVVWHCQVMFIGMVICSQSKSVSATILAKYSWRQGQENLPMNLFHLFISVCCTVFLFWLEIKKKKWSCQMRKKKGEWERKKVHDREEGGGGVGGEFCLPKQ